MPVARRGFVSVE